MINVIINITIKIIIYDCTDQIIIYIFLAINYCASDPCHDGNCTNSVTGYTCECNAGFSGIHCETG